MKTEVESRTYLELRVVQECDLVVQGQVIELRGRKDAAVLVLVTVLGQTRMNEEIVAVATGTREFLKLASYVRADGGITLHRDIT